LRLASWRSVPAQAGAPAELFSVESPGLDGPGALRFFGAHALRDGAGADAAGADPEPLRLAVNDGAHGLQIYFPAALRDVVGMTHVLPELDALAANVAKPSHESS